MSAQAEYHSPAAHSYAEALFNLAKPAGKLDVLNTEAAVLETIFLREGQQLRCFFEAPQIATDEKMLFIERTLHDRVDSLLERFFQMLVRRDRFGLVLDILRTYQELVAREKGYRDARVITAVEVDDSMRRLLQEQLERELSLTLRINYVVDPDVLGGVLFQCDDRLIDGSVRGRLQGLRKRLESVRVL